MERASGEETSRAATKLQRGGRGEGKKEASEENQVRKVRIDRGADLLEWGESHRR